MATVQSASSDNPQDGYVPPPKSPKERRFSTSKEPSNNGMYSPFPIPQRMSHETKFK
jgi:hypothetical protein